MMCYLLVSNSVNSLFHTMNIAAMKKEGWKLLVKG